MNSGQGVQAIEGNVLPGSLHKKLASPVASSREATSVSSIYIEAGSEGR